MSQEKDFRISKRNLPHWHQTGSTFFVTFTLARNQRELNTEEREFIQQVLTDHHGERYHLWAWVVMNDHVHAVLTPTGDWQLRQILHTWKSFSANRLQRRYDRAGQIWLHESYDRIIRSEEELYQKCSYVVSNPQRRWPGIGDYSWSGYHWM